MTQNFPPQAYSKETISEAFMWLQSQPDEVKKKATHTEALLSLYLKNKSQQYWASKTNSSINNNANNFNDQLQEIALEVSPNQNQTRPYSNEHSNGSGQEIENITDTSKTKSNFNIPLSHTLNGSNNETSFDLLKKSEEAPSLNLEDILDAKSLDSLHKTKTKFNLSSNKEAARLLISLGFDQIKSFMSNSPSSDSEDHQT